MKLFLLACFISSTAYGHYSRVTISEGELSGFAYILPNGREVVAYLGVPYAAPPIGKNRFKGPQRPKRWQGVRNATSPGSHCPQTAFKANTRENHVEFTGNEDCLFLNVFTPKLFNDSNNEDDLMNVLVYIHGGAFMFGTGNAEFPNYILQYDDIVYVSFNYRLGPFGFYSTDHPAAPGNYGLKDQVEALRWVQRNIRHFGGNPAKVTIFGCSAGGASVHYHMLSPTTKGLFRNAISSSGSISLPWSLPANNAKASKRLASSLKCRYKSTSLTMKCLRNKSTSEIIDEGYGAYTKDGNIADYPFGPVIEVRHPEAFLSENPYDLMKAAKIKHVPWLVSVTENEGAGFGLGVTNNKTIMNQVKTRWNEVLPRMLKYDDDSAYSEFERDYISASIRKYYFSNKDLSEGNVGSFYQVLGDRFFYNGIFNATKLYSSASLENTYCYKFYYRGTESFSDVFPFTRGKNYGCLHCDNMYYILRSMRGKSKTNNDLDMAKLLSSAIIAFMKNGDPNVPQLGTEWKPLSGNGVVNCLGIYSTTFQRMEDIENHDTTRLWNSILPPKCNDASD